LFFCFFGSQIIIFTNVKQFYWCQGLKTGMYYLRSKPAASAIQFTVDQLALAKNKAESNTPKNNQQETSNEDEDKAKAIQACRRDNPEACLMCSGWITRFQMARREKYGDLKYIGTKIVQNCVLHVLIIYIHITDYLWEAK